jgi:hypothetical protein
MKKLQLSIAILLSVIFIQFSCNQPNKSGVLDKVGLSADSLRIATEELQKYIDNGKLAGISALIFIKTAK